MSEQKTALGLSPELTAALAYVFSFVGGIIVLILEKENRFARFHAMQSIFMSVSFLALSVVAGFIPFVGWLVALFIPIVWFIAWVIAIIKSAQGEYYKFPVIGEYADKQI